MPFKISSYFSTKDILADIHKSRVVYQFTCVGCNSKYIGLTTRNLGTRISEHLNVEKCTTAVAQHLKSSPDCKQVCNRSNFKIIDRGSNETILRIKEALHILDVKPNLNTQIKHENVLLVV